MAPFILNKDNFLLFRCGLFSRKALGNGLGRSSMTRPEDNDRVLPRQPPPRHALKAFKYDQQLCFNTNSIDLSMPDLFYTFEE